ncbi:unnamed protein product [Urochloa humidicola]
MDAKRMTPILLALLLTSLAFPAKCQVGNVETYKLTSGCLRRRPDREEEMVGSSKITIVLCVRTSLCTPGNKTCYCCQTLPNTPCFWTQQECWDACPKASNHQQHQVPGLPPSPAPAVA